jgi:hypothetical protein
MSNSKLEQIKDVMRNHDVRDPRGAVLAIASILDAKSLAPKEPKPSLSIKVFELDGDEIRVTLKRAEGIDPAVVLAARESIDQFRQQEFGAIICDDEGNIVGFEKFGDYKGITQKNDPECNCPTCRMKNVLEQIRGKIEAARDKPSTN